MNLQTLMSPAGLLALAAVLLIALIVLVIERRHAIRRAWQQGRADAEPERVALAHDLEAARARIAELGQRLNTDTAELVRLRERADLLSDDRAA
ncbi:MAG: hypothetical protein GX826_07800, partial [Gammaproteobacteria bacterium]|nr:hypothetical protein [Gammaproteobacteria bacterium]